MDRDLARRAWQQAQGTPFEPLCPTAHQHRGNPKPRCRSSPHLMNRATPSFPICSKASRSNLSPSVGSSSIFQSPVCTMLPYADRRMRPQQSGMECVTRIGSQSNGPHAKRSRIRTVRNRDSSHSLRGAACFASVAVAGALGPGSAERSLPAISPVLNQPPLHQRHHERPGIHRGAGVKGRDDPRQGADVVFVPASEGASASGHEQLSSWLQASSHAHRDAGS